MSLEQMLADRLILDAALIIVIAIVLTLTEAAGRQGGVERRASPARIDHRARSAPLTPGRRTV
jgi:hypothetical protein